MTARRIDHDLRSAAIAATGEAGAAGEQLDMLPEVVRINRGDQAAVIANGEVERRRGRPPGAVNVQSRQLRAMIEGTCGNPLLQMARWAALTPEEIAHRLGITTVEAFDRLILLLRELAPYTAAKLAPVDDAGRAVPNIAVMIGGQGINTDAGGAAVPPWMRAFQTVDGEAVEIEQKQGLSGIDAKPSGTEAKP